MLRKTSDANLNNANLDNLKVVGSERDGHRSRKLLRVDGLQELELQGKKRLLVLVAGAGVRAAVESLQQAGVPCVAACRYDDWDLRKQCCTVRIERYTELRALVRRFDFRALVFTGPLENRPALLRRLGQDVLVWGVSPETLRRVRCPWNLQKTAQKHGLFFPESRRLETTAAVQTRERSSDKQLWVVKPLAGAGGVGVQTWTPSTSTSFRKTSRCFLQRFVSGRTLGGVFVSDGRQRCQLLALNESFTLANTSQLLWAAPLDLNRSTKSCGRSENRSKSRPETHSKGRSEEHAESRDEDLRGRTECHFKHSTEDHFKSRFEGYAEDDQACCCPLKPEQRFLYAGSFGPLWPSLPETHTDKQSVSACPFQPVETLHFEHQPRPALPLGSSSHLPAPEQVDLKAFEQAAAWGKVLTSEFGLKGIFGCDFVWDGQRLWLLEVNPRFTASVEVVEQAAAFPLSWWHVSTFLADEKTPSTAPDDRRFPDKAQPTLPPSLQEFQQPNASVFGSPFNNIASEQTTQALKKLQRFAPLAAALLTRASGRFSLKLILYAGRPLQTPPAVTSLPTLPKKTTSNVPPAQEGRLADVPPPGSFLPQGAPVCTVSASGESFEGCVQKVRRQVNRLQEIFSAAGFPRPFLAKR